MHRRYATTNHLHVVQASNPSFFPNYIFARLQIPSLRLNFPRSCSCILHGASDHSQIMPANAARSHYVWQSPCVGAVSNKHNPICSYSQDSDAYHLLFYPKRSHIDWKLPELHDPILYLFLIALVRPIHVQFIIYFFSEAQVPYIFYLSHSPQMMIASVVGRNPVPLAPPNCSISHWVKRPNFPSRYRSRNYLRSYRKYWYNPRSQTRNLSACQINLRQLYISGYIANIMFKVIVKVRTHVICEWGFTCTGFHRAYICSVSRLRLYCNNSSKNKTTHAR